ncbi:uncharacterized protein LOC111619748 [Centruroides sculpturatus]|uniref:uncharacterized protein LOC111619748 n=1 Tax=Centruroides sculpturatus TaxID=218467 RepID=UPI000C6E2B6E|nr:uncharacterized protein LOC111619748 [Centruroides sculpturatus]XP_023217335.1 uncharacterized protein LOC111619748 [Centruroides sculpturatus]XP_023217336.1 uncharacterized protein LOC111619748 [Centruroides sculpturatus]XP_023217337.1 uncharacterized protein LOC111619748 [Centruroides sculpturatus]
MKCQCQLHQCCCFKNSKDASLASGIYTTVVSAIGLITVIAIWSISEFHPSSKYFFIAVYASSLTFCLIFLLFSLLLVYAVIKKKRLALIPWITCLVILMLSQLTAIIVFFVLEMLYGEFSLLLICAALLLATLGLHIVCFLVVITYYRSLEVPQRTEE